MGRTLPCAVGRGGITHHKREGDGGTPAGAHRIVGMLFRPDRIARCDVPSWARAIGPQDGWSDDPHDQYYNCPVRRPHAFGHERLHRADPLYDLVLLTDWNLFPAHPGCGSAIFVHCWRAPRFPTAGCVAFSRTDLLWIAARIASGTRLVVKS